MPHNASRIAAQTAKQVVLQRLREAERELLYQEFFQHQNDIVSGVIEQTDAGRSVTLDLGRAQAILPYEEQVPTERYRKGQRTKVYVLSVRNSPKGPEIIVSRSHKDMLRRLFEIEVPEVYNGVVEIQAIAREAGFRSKVAVSATQAGDRPGRLLYWHPGKSDPKHCQRAPRREDRCSFLGQRPESVYLQGPKPFGASPC